MKKLNRLEKLQSKGKDISINEKFELKKLLKSRDKQNSPVTSSGVFISNEISESNNIKYIEIDKIKLPKFKDRSGLNLKKVEELAKSIRDVGLLQPIIVEDNKDGTYTKLVGNRRIAATKLNSNSKIKAIVITNKLVINKINLMILHENLMRDDLSAYDKVRSVLNIISCEFNISERDARKLINKVNNLNKGVIKSTKELEEDSKRVIDLLDASKAFKTTSALVKYLPILDMDQILLDSMFENKITYEVASAIIKYKNSEYKNNSFSNLLEIIETEHYSKNEAIRLLRKNLLEDKEIISDIDILMKKTTNRIASIGKQLSESKKFKFEKELAELIKRYD